MPVLDKTIIYTFSSHEKYDWLDQGFIIHFINNYRLYIYINQRELFQLRPGCSIKIECICNMCQNHFSAAISHIHKLNNVNYTLCKYCRNKYRYLHNKEECKKRAETNLKKYGFANVSQVPEIKQKRINTIQNKYGKQYTSTSQIPEVRIKQIQSLCKHNNVSTSIPQKQLHKLINGFLNFPVGMYPIDIAFPDEKIAVEYNGGGHDLSVKFHAVTREQFIRKEIKRKYFLLNRKWNIITIITPTDKLFNLYTDYEIIELINIAKQYFSITNHHWLNIYIEENRIEHINGNITINNALYNKKI